MMMIDINEENQDKLEAKLIENNCDINEYINYIYNKYLNLFKMILLSFCIIIVIILFKRSKFVSKNENNDKIEDNQDKIGNNLNDKSDKELNDKSVDELEHKTDNIIDDKTDNELNDKTDSKIDYKTDNKIDDKTDIIINKEDVNLYIITHKYFKSDIINNSNYKILCDDRSQLKNNYSLEIIPKNSSENILYSKRHGYCEGSKMYYIWNLYKSGNISSKYVGFFHYRRIFPFKNNIPDLDTIFQKYDVILKKRTSCKMDMYQQFKKSHVVQFLDDAVDIIKEKFNEYYPYVETFFKRKWANFCNIFIMKKR